MTRALFHYDLRSPHAWLAAERISGVFAGAEATPPEWRPVLIPPAPMTDQERLDFEQLARSRGLPDPRWPKPASGDGEVDWDRAALGVLYAAEAGRVIAVTLAAFRQQFAGGRDIGDPDTILIAAASCELHPNAVTRGIESRAIVDRLEANTAEAQALGVTDTPSVSVGDRVFVGEDALESAARASVAG